MALKVILVDSPILNFGAIIRFLLSLELTQGKPTVHGLKEE